MKQPRFLALLLTAWSIFPASAIGTQRTECIGYYTLNLPGAIEYPAIPISILHAANNEALASSTAESRFKFHLPADTKLIVDTLSQERDAKSNAIHISEEATVSDLKAVIEKLNQERKKLKEEFLDDVASTDSEKPGLKEIRLIKANAVKFFSPIGNASAFGSVNGQNLDFFALVGNHIIRAKRQLSGSPEQTVNAFLKHYRPRDIFEIPTQPGVCLPYSFMDGETQPSHISTYIHLIDRPDVLLSLEMGDASDDAENPTDYIKRNANPNSAFLAAEKVEPLDGLLKAIRDVTVDGHIGKGAFVRLTRNSYFVGKQPDWGYLAYIPGKPGGRPGESFNLVLKVERFERYAKAPMTEKEFRALVKEIAGSIRRRPGAWVVK